MSKIWPFFIISAKIKVQISKSSSKVKNFEL